MDKPFDKTHIIGKMLKLGLIDHDTVTMTLTTCRGREIDILKVLANFAGMTKEDVRNFAKEHFNLPELDLNDIVLNPDVVRMVPHRLALDHRLLPAFKISGRPLLAVSNPFDFAGIDQAKSFIGEAGIFLASEEQVLKAIQIYCAN